MRKLYLIIFLSLPYITSSQDDSEVDADDLLITDLDSTSPIDFEVIDEGDEEDLEALDDWTDNAEDNMEEILLLPEFPTVKEMEEEIEYYEMELGDLELFETVEIYGITYDFASLAAEVLEMYDFLKLLEMNEELLELEEATENLDNSKSPEQFELSIQEAEELAKAMSPEIVVVINDTTFTSERLIDLIEDTIVVQDANLETQVAAGISIIEGSSLEDILETEADALSALINIMEEDDYVLIEGVTYNVTSLEEWLTEDLKQVADMDGLDDIESDTTDVVVQLAAANECNDDCIDEIEEIEELLGLTSMDPIPIGTTEYTVAELEGIIEEDKEQAEQFLIDMQMVDIEDLFVDYGEDEELDLDDQMSGLEEIADLIAVMDNDDVVVLDGIEFDKITLEAQLDQAFINLDNQLEKKLGEMLSGIDLGMINRSELDEVIEDAELLVQILEPDEIVMIDETEYTLDEVEDLLDDLLEKEEEFAQLNEIEDIEALFGSFEGVMQPEDFDTLQVELQELVDELDPEDQVKYGEELMGIDELESFIVNVGIVGDELDGGSGESSEDLEEVLELFEGFEGEMYVQDFDDLGEALQIVYEDMESDVEIGGIVLSEEGVGSLIGSVDVMGDELGEDSDRGRGSETEISEFLALI